MIANLVTQENTSMINNVWKWNVSLRRKECWSFYWAVNTLSTYYLWSFYTSWHSDMFKWKNLISSTLDDRDQKSDLTWSSMMLVSFYKVWCFLLFCFLNNILLGVHKQGGKIQDMYLECDAYLPQAFLAWKGKYFLWHENYSVSKFAGDKPGDAKFIAFRNHILGLYFELDTFAYCDDFRLLFTQLYFPVLWGM